MSTDVEAFLYLIETAEELLLDSSLHYDQVLKYEVAREKVFKKVGLPQSSSKLWRVKSEMKSRSPVKVKNDVQEPAQYEYIERLSCSHETTLRYARLVKEILESCENLSHNLALVLDSSAPVNYKALKACELDQIYYKDLSKFKEMDSKEIKTLESYSKDFAIIEKNFHGIVLKIEEKNSLREKFAKNLEEQIEGLLAKNKNDREESQIRLDELLGACHDYAEEIERLKVQNGENLAAEKKILQRHIRKSSLEMEKNSSQFLEIIEKLENEVKNLNKESNIKEKKIEKLSESLKKSEKKNSEIQKESENIEKSLKEQFNEKSLQMENRVKDQFTEKAVQLETRVKEYKQKIEIKEHELEEVSEKVKFLQEELCSYKFNRDQEMKLRTLEEKEFQELKVKNNDLKDELSFYKAKAVDHKELLELKKKYAELKEELDLYRTKATDARDSPDIKPRSSGVNFYKSRTNGSREAQSFKNRKIELKDELKFQKARSSEDIEVQDLRNQNKNLKDELAVIQVKLSEIKEEMLVYKDKYLECRSENSELKMLTSKDPEDSAKATLLKVQELIHKICERFDRKEHENKAKETLDSNEFSQMFSEIEFLAYMISKLANDNDWLVDRLSDIGRENYRLKIEINPKRAQEDEYDLKATCNALKEFENSRSQIFYHYAD